MRIRIVLIISTLCLLVSFICLEKYITTLDYETCDILEMNDIYKSIEEGMQNDSIAQMEEKYSCNIILKTDMDYENNLYRAIKNGSVILDYLKGDTLLGKIIIPANSNTFRQLKVNLSAALWILFAVIILVIYVLVFIIYLRIIRPFKRLERFADNISVGNLELPLTMDRGNYFGAFTESFDMMREELKKARQGEYEANRSKKELVAGLSHDIKTPVATIKALCEILEIKLQDVEHRNKINTINQKADMIDKLISNMFHATLEELEALKIEPCEELSTILPPMFAELNHYGKIQYSNQLPECMIICDKLRLNQVIDNVINNSYKYANTEIAITYGEYEKYITIEIRDYGTSILDTDIPLVFEKFYRGENASTQNGSGLGLYLAKQFMEGMKGGIECYSDNGFVVVLTVRKV